MVNYISPEHSAVPVPGARRATIWKWHPCASSSKLTTQSSLNTPNTHLKEGYLFPRHPVCHQPQTRPLLFRKPGGGYVLGNQTPWPDQGLATCELTSVSTAPWITTLARPGRSRQGCSARFPTVQSRATVDIGTRSKVYHLQIHITCHS